jgi:DNA-binding ferritin-like protein (Dps family)
MNAKDLIALNNEKRKQLNEHNRNYYEDMLVYIRSHLLLSEQQSEELLMELLDHLLEAQKHGKSAEDVFGKDTKAYCDELIGQLPKEKKRNIYAFIGYLMIQLFALITLATGAVELVAELFTDVDDTVYLGKEFVLFVIDFAVILLVVALVMLSVRKSVFCDVLSTFGSKVKEFLVVLFAFCLVFGMFILMERLVPEFGYRIEAGGMVRILFGLFVLAMTWLLNKKFRITK